MLCFLILLVGTLVPVSRLYLLNNYKLFPIDYLLFYLLLKLYNISNLLIKLVAHLPITSINPYSSSYILLIYFFNISSYKIAQKSINLLYYIAWCPQEVLFNFLILIYIKMLRI